MSHSRIHSCIHVGGYSERDFVNMWERWYMLHIPENYNGLCSLFYISLWMDSPPTPPWFREPHLCPAASNLFGPLIHLKILLLLGNVAPTYEALGKSLVGFLRVHSRMEEIIAQVPHPFKSFHSTCYCSHPGVQWAVTLHWNFNNIFKLTAQLAAGVNTLWVSLTSHQSHKNAKCQDCPVLQSNKEGTLFLQKGCCKTPRCPLHTRQKRSFSTCLQVKRKRESSAIF